MKPEKVSKVRELSEQEVQQYIDKLDDPRKARYKMWYDNCTEKGYSIRFKTEGYAVWAEVKGNKVKPYVISTAK